MTHIFLAFDKTPHRNFPDSDLNETMNNFPGGTNLVMESNNNGNITYAISNSYNSMKVLNFVSTPGKGLSLTGTMYESCWCDHHINICVSYSLDLISYILYMIASMLFTSEINKLSGILIYKRHVIQGLQLNYFVLWSHMHGSSISMTLTIKTGKSPLL